MIVTQKEAREIIRSHYGKDFKVKLTTNTQIGVREKWQITVGMPILCWYKLCPDKKGDLPSAIKIGRLGYGGAIDWDWVAAQV